MGAEQGTGVPGGEWLFSSLGTIKQWGWTRKKDWKGQREKFSFSVFEAGSLTDLTFVHPVAVHLSTYLHFPVLGLQVYATFKFFFIWLLGSELWSSVLLKKAFYQFQSHLSFLNLPRSKFGITRVYQQNAFSGTVSSLLIYFLFSCV